MLPTYDSLYMPLLRALADGEVRTNREIGARIASELDLSPDQLQETLTSGRSIFTDRVSWACTYLKKAGLVESVKRGHHRLTQEGQAVLTAPPPVLDNRFLSQYPSFQEFRTRSEKAEPDAAPPVESSATPEDMMEQAAAALNLSLADDLLAEIMEKDSDFFESLVVKLLVKMGYGGSVSDAGVVTKRSHDGGIDGIIREDKLGFDQIYIQAKRWDPQSTVSRPELQKFSGALRDEGASKGLFITTARFSEGAQASAEKQHIVLVDGQRLTKLMIEYNLGVSPVARYEIKSIDSDFFSGDNE